VPSAAAAEGDLRAATDAPTRTDKERRRDADRHPHETLAFFGVRADMRVVELYPGSGYYTAILAPLLAPHGKLAVTHFDANGDPKSWMTEETKWILGRLDADPPRFGAVERRPIKVPEVVLGPPESADAVVTFRNVHNWIEDGYAERVFAAAFRVLRPGGILGVEEHRGAPGMTREVITKTGYVPEDVVVSLASAAGFRLIARSEINANPRDTKDYPKGVWSLPPTFAEKDKDRERYSAIGESDRMTLKFSRP
jgi:predicted methyltransferase